MVRFVPSNVAPDGLSNLICLFGGARSEVPGEILQLLYAESGADLPLLFERGEGHPRVKFCTLPTVENAARGWECGMCGMCVAYVTPFSRCW